MGYVIKQLWARSDRYTAGGNSKEYIVIHNTANTASAANEAKNLHNNPGQSSFQYTLDDVDIYQCVHDYDTAWAVGAWSGTTAYIRNNQSISIEVCSPGTEFTAAEKDRLHWLVQDLMTFHGIPAKNVVRHWDCHSGRKSCPAFYAGANNAKWNELHALITSPYEVEEPKKPLPDVLKSYTDLDSEAWYIDSVEYVVKKGWMTGYSTTKFGPDDTMTRAQAVCAIAKMAGVEFDEPFEDVKATPFYYNAVEWAKDSGIVSGEFDTFRPDDPCTRQEFMVMLHNFSGKPKPVGKPTGFPDWTSVAEWAQDAVAWCVEKGVISGSNGKIDPNGSCSRAQAAAMLTNYDKKAK